MTYSDAQVSAAAAAMDKYRGGEKGEVGAALAVVDLSAARATKEAQIRDDMIRVVRRFGRRYASSPRCPALTGRP